VSEVGVCRWQLGGDLVGWKTLGKMKQYVQGWCNKGKREKWAV